MKDEPEPPLLPGWLRLTGLDSERDIHVREHSVTLVLLARDDPERRSLRERNETVVFVGAKRLRVKEDISVVLLRLEAAAQAEIQRQTDTVMQVGVMAQKRRPKEDGEH